MPIATLLLREASSTSLSALVEKSQQRKPPLPEYDLQLTTNQLILIQRTTVTTPQQQQQQQQQHEQRYNIKLPLTDEGFESDIDSLSIVSSDDSFSNLQETKTIETDSANGSASSDSDNESPTTTTSEKTNKSDATITTTTTTTITTTTTTTTSNESSRNYPKEFYNLVDCVCYTDVKFPDVLVFVIKNETLVFKFDILNNLKNFYLNFTALKAVTNQKAYNNKNLGAKFNLLQRTDNNGVTHIEITREPQTTLFLNNNHGPSSIISLNTPECGGKFENNLTKTLGKESRNRQQRSSESDGRFNTLNDLKISSHNKTTTKTNNNNKFPSTENLLNELVKHNNNNNNSGANLRKIWNSAEDLLTIPKRPERRKKGKAPLPPQQPSAILAAPPPILVKIDKEDILRGQYVRVNVDNEKMTKFIVKSQMLETQYPKKLQNFTTKFTKLPTKPLKLIDTTTTPSFIANKRYHQTDTTWTNSVPRLLTKKPRSKSETRVFTPMAYRYIDTTTTTTNQNNNYPITYNSFIAATSNFNNPASNFSGPTSSFGGATSNFATTAATSIAPNSHQTISNRLFGLSSKLKDFNHIANDNNARWGVNNNENNLKSVIKKDENRKKNEKKVTFSAYTTVQVV